MDGLIPQQDDKAETNYRKAVKVLNKVQRDVHSMSAKLTGGSLTEAKGVLGEVTDVTKQTNEVLEFPTELRSQVAVFGDTIMGLQSQAENLRSIPFSDGCVGPLLKFLNSAAKPVRAIREAATKAEEMTAPAKEQCSRAIDLVDETKGKVDWMQTDMGRLTKMVDKFAAAGKNTLRAAEQGNELVEVAEDYGCGKQAKLCIAGMAKSAFNSDLMHSAIKACHAVHDSMTLCHGCADKVVNLKDTMQEGSSMMTREVDVVGNKVGSVKGQMDALIDDIKSFNLSGISTKCMDLKGECDALMGETSNGDALQRKVKNKVMKPLEILEQVVDAIKSLFHTLQEQTSAGEEAEKKTRDAPALEDGKADVSHMQGAMKEITEALRAVIDKVAPLLGIELDPGMFEVLDDDNEKNAATDHAKKDTVKEENDDESPLDDIFGAFAAQLGDALNQ